MTGKGLPKTGLLLLAMAAFHISVYASGLQDRILLYEGRFESLEEDDAGTQEEDETGMRDEDEAGTQDEDDVGIQDRISLYEGWFLKDAQEPQPTKYIFVGDSRTVGMQMAVGGPEDAWACKTSMGYDWMVSEGIPQIEGDVVEGARIYILLGINDLGNAQRYADYVNGKAAEWKEEGASTYFVSVGPVGQTTVTNGQIEAFNATVKDQQDAYEYLDIYDDLAANGYSTVDGLHYTSGTYQYIYGLLKQ